MQLKDIIKPSLARRILLAMLISIFAIWLFVGSYFAVQGGKERTGFLDLDMKILTDSTAQVLEDKDADANIATVLSSMWHLFDVYAARRVEVGVSPLNEFPYMLQIWTIQGVLAYRSPNAPAVSMAKNRTGYFDGNANSQKIRGYSLITKDRQLRIEIAHTLEFRSMVLKEQFFFDDFLYILGIVFFIILIPTGISVLRGLRPLNQLADELKNREADHLEPVRTSHKYLELSPLIGAFNTTLARVRDMRQREQDFLADAAHELRTPLAVITAQADALIHSDAPDQRAESIAILRHGVSRASRIVGQLLVLARLEAHTEESAVDLDLAALVRENLATLATLAESKNIELSYNGPDTLMWKMSGHLFETVLVNLVSNAILHGAQNGLAVITLKLDVDSSVILMVEDDGPGIPVTERARIFERFRRGQSVLHAGSGLGLSIVQAAAQRSRAEIKVTDGLLGSGACFTLRWSY